MNNGNMMEQILKQILDRIGLGAYGELMKSIPWLFLCVLIICISCIFADEGARTFFSRDWVQFGIPAIEKIGSYFWYWFKFYTSVYMVKIILDVLLIILEHGFFKKMFDLCSKKCFENPRNDFEENYDDDEEDDKLYDDDEDNLEF